MEEKVPSPMTLDDFIGHLHCIREEHGGDMQVLMVDYEPVAPPILERCGLSLGDEIPQSYVILTDRL
jgi:hypothetical protein